MAEADLRIALQRCHSRTRLALQALDRYRARLCQLAGPLPIANAAELVSLADGIRDLLTGEEVPEVKPRHDCVALGHMKRWSAGRPRRLPRQNSALMSQALSKPHHNIIYLCRNRRLP